MNKVNQKTKYLIGIDEAGRGPIAGPVAVGGCIITHLALGQISDELLEKFMRGKLKDSKKLSEKKREEIFVWMQEKKKAGELDFVVSMGSAKTIDNLGIVPVINKALSIVLTRLIKVQKNKIVEVKPLQFCDDDVFVKLDGGLRAPEAFKYQETIVRGDENEVVISLASIAAKVTRDEYMKSLGEEYNKEGKDYGFEKHKGYGTKGHYDAIEKHGLGNEHRISFCKNIKSSGSGE